MRQARSPWEHDRGGGDRSDHLLPPPVSDADRLNMFSPFELKKASSYFAAMAAAIQQQQNQTLNANSNTHAQAYRRSTGESFGNHYGPGNHRRSHNQSYNSNGYRGDHYNSHYAQNDGNHGGSELLNGGLASSLRSPILEDFRTNKNRKFEVRVRRAHSCSGHKGFLN